MDPSQVPPQYISVGAAIITKAQAGFAELISEFGGANVIAQITQAGKTKLIADAVKDVIYYGNQGSLWEAYSACEKIKVTPEMAPFITEDRKQQFKNRIIQILGTL